MNKRLSYNPDTGVFVWIDPPIYHPRLRGTVAGKLINGYVNIKIDGVLVRAHRLAWFMSHGSWPNGELDHINGDRADNRLCNLRIATNSQNQANKSRVSGKPVAKGVRITKNGKFEARIRVSGNGICLGRFDTEKEASDAYMAAAVFHYGEFARRD